METGQQGRAHRYLSRPGRVALVVVALEELRGPTCGVVELPRRLMWQPDRRLDLDDPFQLRWLYEIVLREAVRVDELRIWLDGPTLRRLWPQLIVPRGVRRAWEDRFPELVERRLAA